MENQLMKCQGCQDGFQILNQPWFTGCPEKIPEAIENYEAVLTRPPLFTTLRLNTNCGRTTESIIGELKGEITKQCLDKRCLPYSVVGHPLLPDVAVIAGRGPYYREKCSQEVIVDHWCGCAVLRGADVFAQGIKAAPTSLQRGERVSVYADLDGKCKKGLVKPYAGHKLHVGNGIARFSRHELFVQEEKLSGIGVEMTEPVYESPCLSDLLPGLVFPQNLPSVVTGHVLAARPGERVLDMCAAPGGKTTHIATLMQNTGEVFALDKTDAKVKKISENAKNWNLTNIKTFAFNSSKALCKDAEFQDRPPFPPECFDRVLLDGPCSALGQRPMLVNKMTSKELSSYPRLQKSLFTVAVNLLKRGGTLVYSTCTVTLEENEGMVVWALNKFPSLQLASQEPHVGSAGRKLGGLSSDDCQRLQRFDPYTKQPQQSVGVEEENSSLASQGVSTTVSATIAASSGGHCATVSPTIAASSGGHCTDSLLCSKESVEHFNSPLESDCEEASVTALPDIDQVNSDTIGFFIAKFIKTKSI